MDIWEWDSAEAVTTAQTQSHSLIGGNNDGCVLLSNPPHTSLPNSVVDWVDLSSHACLCLLFQITGLNRDQVPTGRPGTTESQNPIWNPHLIRWCALGGRTMAVDNFTSTRSQPPSHPFFPVNSVCKSYKWVSGWYFNLHTDTSLSHSLIPSLITCVSQSVPEEKKKKAFPPAKCLRDGITSKSMIN